MGIVEKLGLNRRSLLVNCGEHLKLNLTKFHALRTYCSCTARNQEWLKMFKITEHDYLNKTNWYLMTCMIYSVSFRSKLS